MIDQFTFKSCQEDPEILRLKIRQLEFAIEQSEEMISEARIDSESLTFLRRKIANSLQDLEILYLLRNQASS